MKPLGLMAERVGRKAGTAIDRIVIHITAGGPRIDGTIAWFQDGERRNAATGEVGGVSVDMARTLAQRLGLPLDLVVFDAGLSCTWEVHAPVRKHYRFG